MAEPCPVAQGYRILVTIIAKRRALYDRWFHEQCMLASLARAGDAHCWKDRSSELDETHAHAHQATINLMILHRLKQDRRERGQFGMRQIAVPHRGLQNRMLTHECRIADATRDDDADRER